MDSFINKVNKNKLALFLTILFLFTISLQSLFKENHVLLIYALKNFEAFKNLNNDFVTEFTNHVPIYTGITFFLSKYFSLKSLYLLHYTLFFICTFAIFKIFDKIFKFKNFEIIIWFTLYFILFHENSYFTGVAGQSVINQTLQPSSFGIFFFVSIAFYLNSYFVISILSLCVAVYFHPTYLIHSIFFISGYLIFFLRDENYKGFLKLSIIYILLIMPVIFFLYKNFVIDENQINELAQKILVEKRIPHHANITHWFSYKDLISIFILFSGLFLIRKNQFIFIPIFTVTILAISITLIQYFSNNYFIALLFPWRSSVFLMPLTSLIILSFFIKKIKLNKNILNQSSLVLFIFIFSALIIKNIFIEEKYNKILKNKKNLFEFINNTKGINLLVAPTYLEDIRLNSSVPIFVNWKFHAFKNDEIIEWYERIKIVNQFYGAKNKDDQYTMLNEINSIQNTSHILVDLSKQKKLLIDCKIINFNKKYFLYDSKVCEN